MFSRETEYKHEEDTLDLHDAEQCAYETNRRIKERSNVAEEFIHIALMRITDKIIIGDVEPNAFLSIYNLNPITTRESRLTPDIFFLVENRLVCGDIAVSAARYTVKNIKSNRYRQLRIDIGAANPQLVVDEYNVIFDVELSNLDQITTEMRNLFSTGWTRAELTTFVSDINRINERISYITKNVVDLEKYRYYLNSMQTHNIVNERLEDILVEEPTNVNDYVPYLTEEQLFMHAFEKSQRSDADVMQETSSVDVDDILIKLNEINDSSFVRKTKIKSPLQYVFNLDNNETEKGIGLLSSYTNDILFNSSDIATRNRLLSLLPNGVQIEKMMKIEQKYNSRKTAYKTETTDGSFQNMIKAEFGQKLPYTSKMSNMCYSAKEDNLFMELLSKIKRKNIPKPPESIHSVDHPECISKIKSMIDYLSGTCKNNHTATNITFDLPTGLRQKREKENIARVSPLFDRVNSSRGAVLVETVVKWINDITRIKIGNHGGIYYSIPIQRNMIFLTMTGQSMYGGNPHYNYVTLTRFNKLELLNSMKYEISEFEVSSVPMSGYAAYLEDLFPGQIELLHSTETYIYVLSKLAKVSLDKLEKIATVNYEYRAHAVSMGYLFSESLSYSGSFLLDNTAYKLDDFPSVKEYIDAINKLESTSKHMAKLDEYFNIYLGANALIMVDLHQKPSEILDLLKYVSGINFSEKSNIEKLLLDKLNIMLKTPLDIFLRNKLLDFTKVNIKLKRHCVQAKVIKVQGGILPSSFNVHGLFSLFWNNDIITNSLDLYYAESQLLFQARPKKMYNNQYMQKAAIKVLENNKIMRNEEEARKGSTYGVAHKFDGDTISISFDFNSKFNYSTDAIYHAQALQNRLSLSFRDRHKIKSLGKIHELGINNVSMRGSCKLEENMKENEGKSTTSLYSCLEFLEPFIRSGDTDSTRILNIVKYVKKRIQSYNMSAKEQRGGGRPIGSPDYPSKMDLYLVESIFKIISAEQNQNMLVKGVNRAAKIASINRDIVQESFKIGNKYIRHIVMDQSQFSEGDNCRKFIDVIKFNSNIPDKLKNIMIHCEEKHMKRHQYWPVMSGDLETEYNNDILPNKGTVGYAGWVQGMKNIISTYTHIIAVEWIIHIFNKFYFKVTGRLNDNNVDRCKILIKQIVNSDDSYCIMSHDEISVIHDFVSFMVYAKKYFRLEQNTKKSYVTATIGEIIQKYVANGRVINVWSKLVVSQFRNSMGVDMCRDIVNAIAQLGIMHKDGTPEAICTYMRAELKGQIYRLYNIGKGKFNDLEKIGIRISHLPCELGGWPSNVSTYELCNAGTQAQLLECKTLYDQHPDSNEAKLVMSSMLLNVMRPNSDVIKLLKQSITTMKIKNRFTTDIDLGDAIKDNDEVMKSLKIYHLIENLDNKFNDQESNLYPDDIFMTDEPEMVETSDKQYNLSNEGISAFDGSFARSTINCINWIIKVPNRITRTLDMINTFSSLPKTGLSGLYKERNDIQMAVGDLLEQTNSMIIALSENNFTRNLREKSAANSYAATQRCCSIAGIPIKMSISATYYVILELYKPLVNVYNKSISDDFLKRALTDPTGRADWAAHVVRNYIQMNTIESEGYTANEIPRSEDDIQVGNDIQSILIDIIRPGYLKEQKYEFRDPARLESDKITIMSVYKDWFDFKDNLLNIARTIYFHHINVRRSRYIIAPPLKNRNLVDYLISTYEKTQNLSTQLVGYLSSSKMNYMTKGTALIEKKKHLIRNLLGSMEILIYYHKKYGSAYLDTANNINIDNIKLSDYVRLSEFKSLVFNTDDFNKKHLSILYFMITADPYFLKEYNKQIVYRIDWIKEQKYELGPNMKKRYYGDFIARISKGEVVVEINGTPGDIDLVTSNTWSIDDIVGCLYYFVKNVPFTGFRPPPDRERWGLSLFWTSRNSNSSKKIIYARNHLSRIEDNVKGSSGYDIKPIHNLTLKKNIENLLSLENKFVNYIPLNVDTKMKPGSAFTSKINRFDLINNKIIGYMPGTTIIKRQTDGNKEEYVRSYNENMEKRLGSYKDVYRFTTYDKLNFTGLCIDNIELNTLKDYNLIKPILLNELHTVPKSTMNKFITEAMDSHFIFYELIKLLVEKIHGHAINLNIGVEKNIETVIIDLSDSKNITDLEDDRYDADIGEEITMEIEGNYGVDINIDSKDVKTVMLQLCSLTIDIRTAKNVLSAIIDSKFKRVIDKIASKLDEINKSKDWSDHGDYDTLPDVYLMNHFGDTISLMLEPENNRETKLIKGMIKSIIDSGLLTKSIWESNTITKYIEEVKMGKNVNIDNLDLDIMVYSHLDSIRTILNKIYSKQVFSPSSSGRASIVSDDSSSSEFDTNWDNYSSST